MSEQTVTGRRARWRRTVSKALALALMGSATVAAPAAAAERILFIGNSFTFAPATPVWKYRADTVKDLNRTGYGGMPALFKLFATQLGLDYDVSAETVGGASLAQHWTTKRALVDRAWDHVVLQEFSTLDRAKPGDATSLTTHAKLFAGLFVARNAKVRITLNATWSRADQTYQPSGAWYGHAIFDMGCEIYAGTVKAAQGQPAIKGIAPSGLAFNKAIRAGIADPNPYDGTSFGQVSLWTYDYYHPSTAGIYLEALVVFAKVTGRDPRALGATETAAAELGLPSTLATQLQTVAWETVNAPESALCPA